MTDPRFGVGLLGPPPRPGGRPTWAEIRPPLLVGEYPTPADVAWLRAELRVTAVVSLQEDADLAAKGVRERELAAVYAEHGVHYRRIPVRDGDNDAFAARLGDIVTLLVQLVSAGERVYLHCNAGFNRAPTAAIAFLCAHEGLDLGAARDAVKACRTCVPYMGVLQRFVGARFD
jgi:protein-tyrosine phosphatase